MKKITLYLLVLVMLVCIAAVAVAETGGGCVRCHTDGALMKSLFVPPKGEYRNCYDCHLGKGAVSKSAFILGRNPRDKNDHHPTGHSDRKGYL